MLRLGRWAKWARSRLPHTSMTLIWRPLAAQPTPSLLWTPWFTQWIEYGASSRCGSRCGYPTLSRRRWLAFGTAKLLADKAAHGRRKLLKPVRMGKMLGVGMTGGRRRTTAVSAQRVKTYHLKADKCRTLRKRGLDSWQLFRATCPAGMLYYGS